MAGARLSELDEVGVFLQRLDIFLPIGAVPVDLLFEMLLEFAQQFQVGLRMKTLDAAEVVSKQAIEILLLGTVHEHADVEDLVPHQIGDVPNEEESALLQFARFIHGDLGGAVSHQHSAVGAVREPLLRWLIADGDSCLRPIWKRLQRTVFRIDQGLAQAAPPLIKPIGKSQKLAVSAAPLRRNFAPATLELLIFQILDPGEKRFEGMQATNALVNQPAGIHGVDGAVRGIPVPIVEAKTLVDEPAGVARVLLVDRPMKDHLALITIAGPLVKDEPAKKDGGQIRDFAKQAIGKKIQHQSPAGDTWELRSKGQTWGTGLAGGSKLQPQARVSLDKLNRNLDECRGWHGQPTSKARRPASISLASTRTCWGLFWNLGRAGIKSGQIICFRLCSSG